MEINMEYKKGDIIKFGRIFNENETIEPILWLVMEQYEQKVLLFSYEVLAAKEFHSQTDEIISWENCTLRKWLNTDFINTFFSEEEQSYIQNTEIRSDAELNFDKKKNSVDKAFLFSYEEVYKYFPNCLAQPSVIVAQPIKKIRGQIWCSERTDTCGNCEWWLRTTRGENIRAGVVNYAGEFVTEGYWIYEKVGVRPAMWIDKKYLIKYEQYKNCIS